MYAMLTYTTARRPRPQPCGIVELLAALIFAADSCHSHTQPISVCINYLLLAAGISTSFWQVPSVQGWRKSIMLACWNSSSFAHHSCMDGSSSGENSEFETCVLAPLTSDP